MSVRYSFFFTPRSSEASGKGRLKNDLTRGCEGFNWITRLRTILAVWKANWEFDSNLGIIEHKFIRTDLGKLLLLLFSGLFCFIVFNFKAYSISFEFCESFENLARN